MITVDELKQFLFITTADYDNQLPNIIQMAESWVRNYCGRQFDYGTYTETLTPSGSYVYPTETPIDTVSSVVGYADGLFASGVNVEGYIVRTDEIYSYAFNAYPRVEVTYNGGYTTIPKPVHDAILMLAGQIFDNRFNYKSESKASGTVSYGDTSMIERMLSLYRKVRV
jgi:hypothetical protein